ncbi:MAG: ABC transporter permease, partial [Acidobacteriia bacterium]|nr:ABC transporter permease [Terriglobia bacterium]
MWNDIRYALRNLLQHPGFALTAIVSIALAVGANSTIYTIANGLLLRPLPVPKASEVVTLRVVPHSVSTLAVRGYGESRMSYPDFEDFRRASRSFNGMVAYEEWLAGFARDENAPAQVKVAYQVTADFFRVLQVEPQLGRGFLPEEDQVPGEESVMVLSHDFWKNEFGGDRGAIGRPVLLNNVWFT